MVLKGITKSKVFDIRPFLEERILVVEMVIYSVEEEELKSQVKRLEKVVAEQVTDIANLKKKCNFSNFDREVVVDEAINAGDENREDNIVDVLDNKAEVNEKVDVKEGIDEKERVVGESGDEIEKSDRGAESDVENNVVAYDEADDEGGEDDGMKRQISSSIAENVMRRKYRTRKRKDEMFITPPSTTPRRLKKPVLSLCLTTHDVIEKSDEEDWNKTIDIANNALELALDEYRGRDDFWGHEEVSDAEKDIIKAFLCGEKLAVPVWEGPDLRLNGTEICSLLFGKELRSDLIDCYLTILGGYGKKAGFEIFCMPAAVQTEVLWMLERKTKKRKLKNEEFHDFVSDLTNYAKASLLELNRELFGRCRYIIFPVNSKWHWFLVVYSTRDKQFTVMNSRHSPVSRGTTKVYANFLGGYLRIISGFDIGKCDVGHRYCRQQGADLDCGVYTCLWAECLARDDPVFWNLRRTVPCTEFEP